MYDEEASPLLLYKSLLWVITITMMLFFDPQNMAENLTKYWNYVTIGCSILCIPFAFLGTTGNDGFFEAIGGFFQGASLAFNLIMTTSFFYMFFVVMF